MSDTVAMSDGVQRYVEQAEQMLEEQRRLVEEVRTLKFDTIAVHGLYSMQEALRKNQGAIIEPIFMSTSEGYNDSDELEAALAYLIPAWVYTRIHNPTVHYLETTLALLEGYGCDCNTTALATSSGMSAVFMATDPLLVRKGSEKINFVATAQCYGGTYQQFSVRRMEEQGIEVRWVVHPHETKEWAALIDGNTRFVYGEMPSNPGQAAFDIEEVAEVAHSHGVPLIVDSTIATPALMRPLAHGADIVIHSCSKSMTMSGFGIGGALISRNDITTNIDNPEMKADFADPHSTQASRWPKSKHCDVRWKWSAATHRRSPSSSTPTPPSSRWTILGCRHTRGTSWPRNICGLSTPTSTCSAT